MDDLVLESGAFYLMDRGYLDFVRLVVIHEAQAFYVSEPRATPSSNGAICIRLTGLARPYCAIRPA